MSAKGQPEMTVMLGRIRMKNPVMVASGTFGYGVEYADVVDLGRLGALVVKGISPEPCDGNRPPRMVEVTGGLVNAIGLQNPGVEQFVADYLPFLRRHDVPVIVNIWGRTIEDYAQVAARLADVEGIAGLEINISCPNIKEGGLAFGTDLKVAARVVAAVRRQTTLTLITKLSPNVTDIRAFTRAAQESDAISLINTYPAMVIDIETRRPVLANITGGLSGPAIHPIAVKLVYEAAQVARVPLVAMGGIMHAREALEFIIAGASAVAVGSATFTAPRASLDVIDGIAAYLEQHRIARIQDLVKTVRT